MGITSINRDRESKLHSYPWSYIPPRNQPLPAFMYATAGQPCFFTTRAYRGSSPFANPSLAEIVVSSIQGTQEPTRCLVDVYCVMPDHLHAVVTPLQDGADVREYMRRVKGLSAHLAGKAGYRETVWQPRWYDHVLTDRENRDLVAIAAYIMENPVRKGLCADPRDYPWSWQRDRSETAIFL